VREGIDAVLLHAGVIDADLRVCGAPASAATRHTSAAARRSWVASGWRRAAGAGARQASKRRPRSPVRAAAPSPRPGEQRGQESGSPGTPRQKRDLMYGLFLITLVEQSAESRTAALSGRTGSSGRGGDPSRRRKRNRGAWTDMGGRSLER